MGVYSPEDRARFGECIRGLKKKGIVTFGPRVMILRDKEDEMTKGGLYIPDEGQKRKNTGSIVQLGAGYEKHAEAEACEGVVVGFRVAFNVYDGVEQAVDTQGMGMLKVLVMHIGNLYTGWPADMEATHGEVE